MNLDTLRSRLRAVVTETTINRLYIVVCITILGWSIAWTVFSPILLKAPPLPPDAQVTSKAKLEQLKWAAFDASSWINIRTAGRGWGSDVVIMQTLGDEPALEIEATNLSSDVTLTFYAGDAEVMTQAMLKRLVHTTPAEGQQPPERPPVDTAAMQEIAGVTQHVSPSGTKVLLPKSDAGILFLRAEARAKSGKNVITRNVFVVRSAVGAVASEMRDKTLLWAQDHTTMRSVTEGSYAIYDLQDGVTRIDEGMLGADGTALASLSARNDIAIVRSGSSIAVVPMNVRYESNGWYDGAYFNDPSASVYDIVFAFIDRPLYRPGDTVHFKAVIRNDDDAALTVPSGTTTMELRDAFTWSERPLLTQELVISPTGTVSGDVILPEDMRTGYAYIVIKTEKGQGSITFQVEHFRKPEYSIEAKAANDVRISGETGTFTVTGEYYSGQPLSGAKVTYRVSRSRYYEWFRAESSDYVPPSELGSWYGGMSDDLVASDTITLDANGRGTISLPLVTDPKLHTDQLFTFEASYADEAVTPSYAMANVLVRQGEFTIRETPNSGYSSRTGKGATVKKDVILTKNLPSANVAGVPLDVQITRRTWTKAAGAAWHWTELKFALTPISVTTDAQGRASFDVPTEEGGSYDVVITAKDGRGNVTAMDAYAWAYAEFGFRSGNNDGSEEQPGLIAEQDKKEYRAGDEAKVTLTSVTKERDVLFMTERGYTHDYRIVRVTDGAATVRLPLTQDDIPGIHVAAVGFADSRYDDARATIPVSAEGKKLSVEVRPDRETYGPGDTVTLTVRTRDADGRPVAAETAVWTIDKAILQLADANPLDIFNTFWFMRWDGTSRTHSLMSISTMSAEKGGCFATGTQVRMANGTTRAIEDVRVGDEVLTKEEDGAIANMKARVTATVSHDAPGYLVVNGTLRVTPEHVLRVNGEWRVAGDIAVGDNLIGEDGKNVLVESLEWIRGAFRVHNLTIDRYHTYVADGVWVHNDKGGGTRTVFKDTAYWNPRVRTDANGIATVRFVLPDNLTTWVINGVAATADTKVGTSRGEIKVSKNVIIRPVVPNLLRVGDTMVLSALVQNFTDKARAFATSLTFSAGDATLSRPGTRAVGKNGLAMEYWRVAPKAATEDATLSFSAIATDAKQLADSILLRLPVRRPSFREKRAVSGVDTKEFPLVPVVGASADDTKISLSLSPTILGSLPPAVKYVLDYPYGCTEQTASRLAAAVIAKAHPEIFANVAAGKDLDAMIAAGISRLAKTQNADGGWSWWYGYSEPFISAYVVDYLTLAKKGGASVPQPVLDQALRYFEHQAILPDRLQTDRIAIAYALQVFGSPMATDAAFDPDMKLIDADLLAMLVLVDDGLGKNDMRDKHMSELSSRTTMRDGAASWSSQAWRRYGTNTGTTALALRAGIASGADKKLLAATAKSLVDGRAEGYWYNTYTTVQVMRALADYAAVERAADARFSWRVTIDGREIERGNVAPGAGPIKDVVIPASMLTADSKLRVEKDGIGTLYWTVSTDATRTDLEHAPVAHGVTIERTYENRTSPGTPYRVGDVVRVTLTIGAFAGNGYAVVTDELPAGLVPVIASLNNEAMVDDNNWYQREYTKNGVIFPSQWTDNRERTYTYDARVISEGSFIAPPATVELMYTPSVFARTSFQTFKTGQFE